MRRKQKWEKEFEAYDKQAEIEKINELSAKFEAKSITKEEYAQLNKKLGVYKNVEKVANIVELKNQLEEERDKINKEIEKIKKEQKLEEETMKDIVPDEQLEEELNKIQEELAKVSEKLKSKDLSDEDKEKLEKQRTELINKKDQNNKKFAENKEKISKYQPKKDVKDIKELEEKKDEIGIKISKCCFVGKMLMAGKSWEYIEIQHEKNKKYTSKDSKLTEKVSKQDEKHEQEKQNDMEIKKQEELETDNTLEEINNGIRKDVEKISQEETENNYFDNKEESKDLVKQNKFKEKHPRLFKIFESIKNLFNRKNNEKDDQKYETIIKEEAPKEVKEEIIKEENVKEENVKEEIIKEDNAKEEINSEKTQRDEFLDYLKVVSEKGIDQVKKDAAKQKFEENKKTAYARETEKFGKEYAEMSYKEERD